MPDSGPGYDPATATENPLSGFKLAWEKEGKQLLTYDPSGNSLVFESANTVTIDDTNSYNLKSVHSAILSLNLMDGWIESLSKERSRVGANLQRLMAEKNRFQNKLSAQDSALSRIADTDYASESTNLAKNQIRSQASMAILAQGQENRVSLRKLLSGVNAKGSKTNPASQGP